MHQEEKKRPFCSSIPQLLTNMNVDLVTVKCLLQQLNNIIANSTRATEPFGPSEQHAGINGGLGDREGESEAELKSV